MIACCLPDGKDFTWAIYAGQNQETVTGNFSQGAVSDLLPDKHPNLVFEHL